MYDWVTFSRKSMYILLSTLQTKMVKENEELFFFHPNCGSEEVDSLQVQMQTYAKRSKFK